MYRERVKIRDGDSVSHQASDNESFKTTRPHRVERRHLRSEANPFANSRIPAPYWRRNPVQVGLIIGLCGLIAFAVGVNVTLRLVVRFGLLDGKLRTI